MANFSLTFDKLLIFEPNKSRSTCHIFVSRQSPVEEKNLGKLFLLAEINSNEKININIINDIQEELKHSFYNTEDLQVEAAFEKALERVNQKIADLVGDYDTNWLDKLNIIAAVIKDDLLLMSYIGRAYPFLIRNTKITNILETTDQAEPYSDKINPLKAFSNIISGNLLNDDILVFCNSSLLDYLSQEKLKRTVSENSPSRAVSLLENLLVENVTNTAFCAIILKCLPNQTAQPAPSTIAPVMPAKQPQPVTPTYAGTSQSSMDNLMKQKTNANEVLTPSLTRHLIASIHGLFLKAYEFFKLKILRQSPRRLQFEKKLRHYRPAGASESTSQKSRLSGFLNILRKVIRAIWIVIISLATQIKKIFSNKEAIAGKITKAPTTFNNGFSNLIIKIKNLPTISKSLLLAVLVIAFVLSQSLFTSVISKQREQKNIEYDKIISTVSQNILLADAALSYGNEDGAKNLLYEAQNQLATIPEDDENRQVKIQELTQAIQSYLEKTKHMANMAATEIATFQAAGATVKIQSIELINNTIYAIEPALKTIYSADLATGEIKSWAQTELENTFQNIINYNNNLILFDTANGLNEFNTISEEYSTLQFTPPSDTTNVIDIGKYENRIYLLDIGNNQIYRSTRITGGYSQPTKWVKDDTNLRDAKSIAIDGNVYVLKNNGKIYKLALGSRQNWSVAEIDPVLDRADKIFTNPETDNIFILDIQGQRIIEYNKDGKLINQYISDSFTDLKDFTVDFTNKVTYVLNGNTILKIDILPRR